MTPSSVGSCFLGMISRTSLFTSSCPSPSIQTCPPWKVIFLPTSCSMWVSSLLRVGENFQFHLVMQHVLRGFALKFLIFPSYSVTFTNCELTFLIDWFHARHLKHLAISTLICFLSIMPMITSSIACERKEPVFSLFTWNVIYTIIFQSSFLFFNIICYFILGGKPQSKNEEHSPDGLDSAWMCLPKSRSMHAGSLASGVVLKAGGDVKLIHCKYCSGSVNAGPSGWIMSHRNGLVPQEHVVQKRTRREPGPFWFSCFLSHPMWAL